MNDSDACLTISVPQAGRRYLGLSRGAAYAAAGRGEIPTLRVGKLLRVPVKAMERMRVPSAGSRCSTSAVATSHSRTTPSPSPPPGSCRRGRTPARAGRRGRP